MFPPQSMKHCRQKARNLSLYLVIVILIILEQSVKKGGILISYSFLKSFWSWSSYKTPFWLKSWVSHFSRADQIWRYTDVSCHIQRRFMTVLNSIQCGHHTSGRATTPNFRVRDITAPSPQGFLHINLVLIQASFPGRLVSFLWATSRNPFSLAV